jgi:hypothetical protein
VCDCGFDLSGPGYDKTASSCAQGNECLGIITGRILLHKLLEYQLCKKDDTT